MKRTAGVLVACLSLVAVVALSHFATAGIEDPPVCDSFAAGAVDQTFGGQPIGTGLNYSTGFEPEEGFPLGYISNTPGTHPAGCGGPAFPCWGHTTSANASVITPTIESSHPHTGLQHLRLIHDPTTRTNQPGFGVGVDASYPRTSDVSARPVAPNTVSVDMAISAPGGMSFRVQPLSNSQGLLATSVLFYSTGEIYIGIVHCESGEFYPTGFQWDTTGAYQNFTVAVDPCVTSVARGGYGGDGTVNYYYGGNLIYSGSCLLGTTLEQLRVIGDNFPGSHMDVDNVVMTSLDECPHTCGNGVIEYYFEECEVTSGGDAVCPGRCVAAGQPDECTCTPICTQDNPCPVENGENGPFISSSGYYIYTGNSPFVSVDGCGSDFDGHLTLRTATALLISNENCQRLGGPTGANSDPTAPCYAYTGSQADPCTCTANPNEPILITLFHSSPFLGSSAMVNIRKKTACAGASVGACCDSNAHDGDPAECTENVVEADCSGPYDVWADQGKCDEIVCECTPDCAGRICGDDGCGGSCGICDDGIACTIDTCSEGTSCLIAPNHHSCRNDNVCDGNEQCDPQAGCVPGGPLVCDDGLFCNGVEGCHPTSGCFDDTDPCDPETEECDEGSDQCVPNVIPTVSQWGLVVLTIVLLVAAKVQFPGSRRVSRP